ncbi:MAG: hypothetical protein MUF18_09410 [Fimbriiglobus sp.]|nr:hypothetical protein [Fimbriiglobus sp.]
MNTLLRLALGGFAAIGLAAPASAQFPHGHPHGHPHCPPPPVVVERPVFVAPPPVVVERPVYIQRPPVVVEKPVYIERPPVVVERPVVVEPQLPVYCLDTFARDFRPTPGRHHIAIVHPVTGRPVEVCFTLPDRRLKEVEVRRREIEFTYGLGFKKVELEFLRNGTVKVNGG